MLDDRLGEDELVGGAGPDLIVARDEDGVTPDSVYGDLNANDTDADWCGYDPTDRVVAS